MLKKKIFYMIYLFPNMIMAIDFPLIQYKYETPIVRNISAVLQKIPDTYKEAHGREPYLSTYTKMVLACGAGAAVAGITATIAWWKAKQKYQDKINTSTNGYNALFDNQKELKKENVRLKGENERLKQERADIKKSYDDAFIENCTLKEKYNELETEYRKIATASSICYPDYIDNKKEIYCLRNKCRELESECWTIKNNNLIEQNYSVTLADHRDEELENLTTQVYQMEETLERKRLEYINMKNFYEETITKKDAFMEEYCQKYEECNNKYKKEFESKTQQFTDLIKDLQNKYCIEQDNTEYYKDLLYDTLRLNIPIDNSSNCTYSVMDILKKNFSSNNATLSVLTELYEKCQKSENKKKTKK